MKVVIGSSLLVEGGPPKVKYIAKHITSSRHEFALGEPPMEHFTVDQTCKHGGCEMAIMFLSFMSSTSSQP
jgi:hypothetical protein